MKPYFLALVVVAVVSYEVNAQSVFRFQNEMQTVADVIITPVGGTQSRRFTIGANNVSSLRIPDNAQEFDIQIVPRDEPDSGFRLLAQTLPDLSAEAADGIIRLNGSFADDVTKLVCYKRRCRSRRCRCRYVTTRGERVAVGLQILQRDGTVRQVSEAKKEKGGY